MKYKYLSLFILAGSFYSNAFTQPGTLDSSFGDGGKEGLPLSGNYNGTSAIAIQTDGEILIAGGSSSSTIYWATLRRLDKNGALKLSVVEQIVNYDSSGYKYSDTYAAAMAIQTDGKIVVAGEAYGLTEDTLTFDFALMRFNSDLSIDQHFGQDGKLTIPVGLSDDGASSVAIQTDGKILVSGRSYNNSVYNCLLVRCNSNGLLDTTFGSGGKVITAVGDLYASFPLAIQPDGKIIVAASLRIDSNYDFVLFRYNTDGSLDSSFGINGKVITDVVGFNDFAYSVAIQPDGKILVGGSAGTNNSNKKNDFTLLRYNTDGSLDDTFDEDGKVITDILGFNDYGNSVAIQPDGKILLGGSAGTNSLYPTSDFALVRYNSHGSLDKTFNNDGKVTGNIKIDDELSTGFYGGVIAIQIDGKIIIAGESLGSGISLQALARYNGDETLPITLISFTGAVSGKNITINWQTASELNNSYFSLEHSSNGIHFSEIAQVKSKGNSSTIQQYNYNDYSPLNGKNYYRLKQVDFDGYFTYSKTIIVNLNTAQTITLYPLPAKNTLHVRLSGKAIISLTNEEGKTCITKAIDGNGVINVAALAAGIYYLKNNNTGETQKIVITK